MDTIRRLTKLIFYSQLQLGQYDVTGKIMDALGGSCGRGASARGASSIQLEKKMYFLFSSFMGAILFLIS